MGVVRRVLRFAGVFVLVATLVSCGRLDGDSCTASGADGATVNPRCKSGFFSASRQRNVLYKGNDHSLLYTGESAPAGGVLNVARLNGPPPSVVPFTGYADSVRIDFAPQPDAVQRDMLNLQNAGATAFDPEERVTIDFNRATVDFVLRQLLGGALGVNYIAPDDLGGSITFRTEEPVPKSQLLYVVRDILTRNGLAMRYVNGIYHIGTPDMVEALQASAQNDAGILTTRVVQLARPNAANVINIAGRLLPENVTVLPSNATDRIILRAPAHDIPQIERTLQSISSDGLGDDKVAIVPVNHSAPESLAAQLLAFYEARIPSGGDMPTIVPLERQRSILIAARDNQFLHGIRQLAQLMDREATDKPTLRVIELRHLVAEEIAGPLNQIIGEGAADSQPAAQTAAARRTASAAAAGTDDASADTPAAARRMPTIPQTGMLHDPDLGSEAAPRFTMRGRTGGEVSQPAATRGKSTADALATLRNPGGQAGVLAEASDVGRVRIVPDPRTNSLMVHSTYADFQRIREVLNTMDVQQSQLVIEAMIVEVELNDHLEHGVQMYLQGPNMAVRSAGSSLPIGGDGFVTAPEGNGAFVSLGGQVGNFRIETIMSALQAITRVKVISSPYLTVLDGNTARLVVGDQISYAVSSQTSQSSGNVTVTQQIEVKDTGIVLDVTPRIYASNSVAMRINQSVSTPSATIQNGNPVISTRQVTSNVLGQSGRTIVLGGLIQERFEDTETGVPILQKAPIIGDLFKSRTDRVRRGELLIMLTPRVIRNTNQLEDITRLLRAQMHPR